jgi:hypothetical protein
LRERAGQVDGRDGLAIVDPGARDADDLEIGALAEGLPEVAKHAVLLGCGRGRRLQAHQVLVEQRGRDPRFVDDGPRRFEDRARRLR